VNVIEEREIQQLAANIRSIEEKLQKFVETTKELIMTVKTGSEIAAVKIESNIAQLISDVDVVMRLVRDGNGKPALLMRVNNLEQDTTRLEKYVQVVEKYAQSLADQLRGIEKGDQAVKQEDRKGRWAWFVAITIGAASLISTVLQLMFK